MKVDIEIIKRGGGQGPWFILLCTDPTRLNRLTSDQFSHLEDLSARRFRDRRLPTRISDTPPRARQNPSKTSQNQLVKDAVLNHFLTSRGWISAVRQKLSSEKKSRPIFSLRTSREKYPEGQETSQRGALSWTKDYPPPSMGYWDHYLHIWR